MEHKKNIWFITCFVVGVLWLFLYTHSKIALAAKKEKGEMAKATVPTQEFFSRLRKEPITPDDSGNISHGGGLTMTYTGPKELFPGEGKYGKLFNFLPLIRWYAPEQYYKHANPPEGKEQVGCERCHGTNHKKLQMPSYNTCGECHPKQLTGHRSGEQGSHTHAYRVSVLEAAWQIEKPAEEVSACATCHAIAENRCDWCHTRHEFAESEARKPNNCGVCHTGLDHYEYEMYKQSYHGMMYEADGSSWDWTKPLKPENYRAPTCAFCHMKDGEHNVMKDSTIYSHMGTSLVDRGAPQYKVKREGWIKTCQGCHSPRFAKDQLEAMDEAVKVSFTKYREAAGIVAALYEDGVLDPMPEDLAPDWTGHYTFSLYPGGEGRMFNESEVERLNFEMLVYINNAVYKAMAHFAWYNATYGLWSFMQDRLLTQIKA